MDCERCRTAVSARLDGEDPGAPDELVAVHLAQCAACRDFAAAAARLHRSARLAAAAEVPDLTAQVFAAIDARQGAWSRPTLRRVGRFALAAVGVLQLALAVPLLVVGDGVGAPHHVARELGAFDIALGVGFLIAARQPTRAFGLLPMAGVLVACLLAVAGIDLASGRTGLVAEARHLLAVAGVALLWQFSRGGHARRMAPA